MENHALPPEVVEIPAGDVTLMGELAIPAHARGLVLFAHGSGSSRHSPRNRHVADVLRQNGIGTLLFDLLISCEEQDESLRFDVGLLADRLVGATEWAARQKAAHGLNLGYFGASTGCAAALVAAAELASSIKAVVSRGGRPDLAFESLSLVRSPTLLIVGERDPQVRLFNEDASRKMRCPNQLVVVPNATHLFEERGTLDKVADLATRWFQEHLSA